MSEVIMDEKYFPNLYVDASAHSVIVQRNFKLAFKINISAIFIAAVLSLFYDLSPDYAIIQIVVFLVSSVCTIYLAFMKPQKLWYGTRALAESIKTLTWRYMMVVEPFNDTNADNRFIDTVNSIFHENSKLFSFDFINDTTIISDGMRKIRELNHKERQVLYLNDRIEEQHNWYLNKAKHNKKMSRWFSWGVVVTNVAALCLMFCKVLYPSQFYPIDILIITSTLIISWIQMSKYNEISAAYSLTTIDIAMIKVRYQSINTQDELSNFINDAETAFSREHSQWLSRKLTV